MQSVTKEMTVWIVFLNFLIQRGDLRLRPRVFTVLIYPALFDQMLRAATVVLDKFLSQEILLVLTYPQKMLFMTYQVATTAVTKEMTVWIVFLDFLIQGGDLKLRPRVFTVLIYPALFDQMLRAAMVV